MANYSFTDPGDVIPDGSIIDSGNFSQLVPGTEIMKGKTLTINGGNFTNVQVQPEWTVNGGNWTQKSFCTNLNPSLIDKGLTECAVECSHMVSKDEVYIDDVLVDTIYTYKDTRA